MNWHTIDFSHVSDKLFIKHLNCTIQSLYSSFLKFCYFTCLKAHEISQQDVRTSENIGHVVLKIAQ